MCWPSYLLSESLRIPRPRNASSSDVFFAQVVRQRTSYPPLVAPYDVCLRKGVKWN